jgi:hypothetical protein
MPNRRITLFAALVAGAGVASSVDVATAMPVNHALAIADATPGAVETVRWRGRGWGWGAGGFAAGAILGGALARPYYGYGPYYPGYYAVPYYPAYPPPVYGPPVYGGGPPGDAVAYCMQRFRSFDLRSGTYLGFDGARHPCP